MKSAAHGLAAVAAALGGYVNVSGHRMYYECEGTGRPTVVLDAGSPDTSSTWPLGAAADRPLDHRLRLRPRGPLGSIPLVRRAAVA